MKNNSKERRNNAASAFGSLNIDSTIKAKEAPKQIEKTIEKKEGARGGEAETLNKKKEDNKVKNTTKTGTSITLDEDVLEFMRLYCLLEKKNLSTIINNYLKEEFIPNNRLKSKINKIMDL